MIKSQVLDFKLTTTFLFTLARQINLESIQLIVNNSTRMTTFLDSTIDYSSTRFTTAPSFDKRSSSRSYPRSK